MLTCEIVTSETAFQALADDWKRLQSISGQSLFTDYDFIRACWEHLAKPEGKTLHIVIARANGRLVAVLPLMVGRKQGFRILQSAGFNAFYTAELLTESTEHVAALWEAARGSRLYDFALIRDIETTELSGVTLATFARRHHIDKAPYIKIGPGGGAKWIENLPKKVRNEYRRHTRRLEEQGTVEKHVHTSSPVPDHAIDGMIKMKKAWCAEHGKDGLFDSGGVKGFFADITSVAASRGDLFFSWTKCNDRTIAYNLGFKYRQKLYAYIITFDAEWAAYSPGTTSMIDAVSWAADNGLTEFDLLQGEARYKTRMTGDSREYAEWTFSSSATGKLKERVFITLRSIKRRLRPHKITSQG